MPLTKQYLRYSPCGAFNIISSPGCNNTWCTLKGQDGRFVATGACEDIIVWDMHLGERSVVIPCEKSLVTRITASPNKRHIAAGFRDGTVKTFDVSRGETLSIFTGHKSAVTTLCYDKAGHRLASGSKDTNVVVWDIISESGIARLSSHTGPITQVAFLNSHNILISASEDTSVKFWDLDTCHCFKTLLGHRTEVWSFVLMCDGEFLVTGCGDSELRVWNLKESIKLEQLDNDVDKLDIEEENDGMSPIDAKKMGSVLRASTKRVQRMNADKAGQVLCVHGTEDSLELFRFVTNEEALRRLRKRKRKERKKLGEIPTDDSLAEIGSPALQDIVKRLPAIKVSNKVKSADIVMGPSDEVRIALNIANNSLEMWSLPSGGEVTCVRQISQQGHRSDVRTLAWSSDGLAVASGGNDGVKLWNRASLAALRTVQVGQVISLAFAPGDRHLLAGTKDGRLLILDVNVGEIVEEINSHSTELWSIVVAPNQRSCVTGAGDSTVKFWDFELLADSRSESSVKVLSLLHKRTLTLEEPVLCVRIAPDSKLIAVALLDMTIKLFFMDTLKFFLSLYGHKLPVTCMDITHDSTLLVSASADRNIKLWGLDFGDCRKSIFAHDAAVTSVEFVPETHYFFSVGKDGRIKQWDADNYQNIITLQGHFGEAWALAISPNGSHVVSTGSDRVLRLLERTEEPLVLEDEQEADDQLITGHDSNVRGQGEMILPTRKTVSSELGAEQLIECLDVCRTFQAEVDEFERSNKKGQPPQRPPLMLAFDAKTVDDFLVNTIRRVRASELEEALMLLPFSSACDLLQHLPSLLSKDHETELVVRTLTFLLKVHHGPIVSSKELLPLLSQLQQLANAKVGELRDMVGRNLFGLHFLQRNIEQREGVQLFREANIERKSKSRKKKRKEIGLKRAILMI